MPCILPGYKKACLKSLHPKFAGNGATFMTSIKANRIRNLIITSILLCLLSFAWLPAGAQSPVVDTEVLEEPVADTPAVLDETVPPFMRQVPDSVVSQLKKKKEFAYANDPGYWSEKIMVQEDPKPYRKGFWDYFYDFFSNADVRMFFYLLIGAVLLFAIYRIAVVNNLYMTRRSKKVASEELGLEEIESDDLDSRINKAVAEKNHRLAVRYLYLKALQLLNERGWIRFHAQATNYEYVIQMNKYPVAEEFRFLTSVYDYVWYGEFELKPEQFELVHNNFKNFFLAIK